MARPQFIQLNEEPERWVDVPMTGANQGATVVALASPPGTLTVLCRFPAGFDRQQHGGYLAAEEFLVLEGSITFEGVRYVRGDLVFVPRSFRRTNMHAADGCTVVAWFGGTADFVPVDQLAPNVTETVQRVSLDAAVDGHILSTSEAQWSLETSGEVCENSEVVDGALTCWGYGAEAATIAARPGRWLHRRRVKTA